MNIIRFYHGRVKTVVFVIHEINYSHTPPRAHGVKIAAADTSVSKRQQTDPAGERIVVYCCGNQLAIVESAHPFIDLMMS